ncbi:tyrosine-type recombinase/integrase [Anaerovorax odorimutans]|uniref:tyrosine-type recombinase/integrase n=1 Tax=Anaerovorax odorimutans TaxID=109327 RepID=UPI000416A9DB
MIDNKTIIKQFIQYCQNQRRLSASTIKAYNFDIACFISFLKKSESENFNLTDVTKPTLEHYLDDINQRLAVKTVKRRFACLRSLYNYLEYEELIETSPFDKFHFNMREPYKLRESMTLEEVNQILATAYKQMPPSIPLEVIDAQDNYNKTNGKITFRNDVSLSSEEYIWVRDIAILELLFVGGVRVSELCDLKLEDFKSVHMALHVHGKGNKERLVYLENDEVIIALNRYLYYRMASGINLPGIFITRFGKKLSSQAVRNLVTKYSHLAGIKKNITPHVFRHTFATLLLEEGVDIKYIQDFLGHSSISTTQIYLHTTNRKKRKIISEMHPRQKLSLSKISSMDNVKLSSEGDDNLSKITKE